MGVIKDTYDLTITLDTSRPIQLRSNALESARQVANKYLETEIPQAYSFKVLVYPHNVIREHKMATGAGADRISRGMSQAFGRPNFVAARMKEGQPIFRIRTMKGNKKVVQEAFRRASIKAFRNLQDKGRIIQFTLSSANLHFMLIVNENFTPIS